MSRARTIHGLTFALLVGVVSPHALAGSWSDLWSTQEQQGQRLLDSNHPGEAVPLFSDPKRRAYAELQAGQYAKAADLLAPLKDADSQYNRGNALARTGKLRDALSAYDEALKSSPGNRDVLRNRELVEKALQAQNRQPQQGSSGKNGKGQQGKSNGGPGSNSSDDKQAGQQGQPNSGGQGQSGSQSQAAQNQQGQQPNGGGQSQSNQQNQSGNQGQSGGQSQAAQNQQGQQRQSGNQGQSGSQNQSAQNQQSQQPNAGGQAQSGQQKQPGQQAQQGQATNASQAARSAQDPSSAAQEAEMAGTGTQRSEGSQAESPIIKGGTTADAHQAQPRTEQALALDQWLRGIPEDSSELLRRKFLIEHMMRQQGNPQ